MILNCFDSILFYPSPDKTHGNKCHWGKSGAQVKSFLTGRPIPKWSRLLLQLVGGIQSDCGHGRNRNLGRAIGSHSNRGSKALALGDCLGTT